MYAAQTHKFVSEGFTIFTYTAPLRSNKNNLHKNTKVKPLTGTKKREISGKTTEEGSILQDGQTMDRGDRSGNSRIRIWGSRMTGIHIINHRCLFACLLPIILANPVNSQYSDGC